MGDNLLYRWFVGLDMDHKVWDHSSFTKNRDRLLNETVARAFFGKVLGLAQWHGLVSSDHFSVDGTLIEAWASMKSFVPKDGSGKPPEGGGRNATVDFKGEVRKNDTLASSTDPEARLLKKPPRLVTRMTAEDLLAVACEHYGYDVAEAHDYLQFAAGSVAANWRRLLEEEGIPATEAEQFQATFSFARSLLESVA